MGRGSEKPGDKAKSVLLLAATLLATSCNGSPFGPSDRVGDQRVQDQGKVLVMAARGEPETVAARALTPLTGSQTASIPRLLNAGLMLLDGQELARAYLAQEGPQLQTDSWRVLPDGRMETSYVLRPNLSWHDGTPLSAEDFVFAWRVYLRQATRQAPDAPFSAMEEVVAPDHRTVLIRWRSLHPKAGSLEARDLQALPRHKLESLFDDGEVLARANFWTTEYVGLGPYKLGRWESGAYLEAVGFEGHAWGRPRIPRIKVLFMSDFDAVLAALVAGEAHVALEDSLRFQQGSALGHEWAAQNGGTVLMVPNRWRHVEIQHRIEYANPRSLSDLRVRRALAYSVDRAAINEALFGGEAILADSFLSPQVGYYPMVEPSLAKYPHDPRRAERLMEEAGYTKGGDGIFSRASDGPFVGEVRVTATQLAEAEVAIMADSWRRAGFDLRDVLVPPAQSRMGEVRAGFPALYAVGAPVGESVLASFSTAALATAKNGWTGSNRSGWTNSEYDRLLLSFQRALNADERVSHIAQMARLLGSRVAAISLYFTPSVVAYAAGIEGPQPFAPESDFTWNVHTWEMR